MQPILLADTDGGDSSGATSKDDRNTDPVTIRSSALEDFSSYPYFWAEQGEVVFRAHCGGATTRGSYYPRSELRQLVNGGDEYWSMQEPQAIETELRITEVPDEKPAVNVLQIHARSE